MAKGYANVLVEIANEANKAAYPEIIKPNRRGELIELVQERSAGKVKNAAGRLYVQHELDRRADSRRDDRAGGGLPAAARERAGEPERIREMVQARTRAVAGFREQPILFNEDDHFDFDKPENNFLAAVGEYAGWGYFDYRMKGEGFAEGYQSVPVDWGIDSARKRGFFGLLGRVTGGSEDVKRRNAKTKSAVRRRPCLSLISQV